MTDKRIILYIFNTSWFFVSHRVKFAQSIQEKGHTIHLASNFSYEDKSHLNKGSIVTHDLNFSRSKFNLFEELRILINIIKIVFKVNPDIIELATIKPIIFAGLICKFMSRAKLIVWMTGLGYIFINQTIKGKVIKKIVLLVYKFIFSNKNLKVIFENNDDRSLFLEQRIIQQNQAKLVMGAGVDIDQFPFSLEPYKKPIVIILPARMLYDKGVSNYVEAAKIVKSKFDGAVRFDLVGDTDFGNPASVSEEQLKLWHQEGIVNWRGRLTNMSDIFRESNIICLPSYREGLPKVLLEAASTGRPIVAFDVPGCREVVKAGVNGILVPLKDNDGLANALLTLIQNAEKRLEMGKNGRKIIENYFDDKIIFKKTLAIYEGQ